MINKAKICLILTFLLTVPSIGLAQTINASDIINTDGIPEISAEADTETIIGIFKDVFIKAWDLTKQLLSTIDGWLENNFNISLATLAKQLLDVIVGIVMAIVDLVKSLIP